MFAALCLGRAPRRGMMGPVLDRLMPRHGVVADRSLFNAGYKTITVFPRGDRVNWREVARLADGLCENMLLPEGLIAPDFIAPFRPARYPARIVGNTAVELLRSSGLQLYRRTIGLVDIAGVHLDLVDRLLPHCLSVRVFTRRPRRYESFADQVLENYGVPLTIGTDPAVLSGCVLVVDPDGELPHTPGLYTLTAADCSGEGVISHLRAGLPGGTVTACEGIDNHIFLAALYELSACETAGALWAAEARLSGRLVTFAGLSREFDSAAGKIAL